MFSAYLSPVSGGGGCGFAQEVCSLCHLMRSGSWRSGTLFTTPFISTSVCSLQLAHLLVDFIAHIFIFLLLLRHFLRI
jgi:hypothetical protein